MFNFAPAPSPGPEPSDAEKEAKLNKLRHRRLATTLGLFLLLLSFVLVLWLLLLPSKPTFTLQDATVFAFNLSSANALTTTAQVTLSARNSNGRIGIFYDTLEFFAVYRGQQITAPAQLPPAYQGRKESAVWSPFLYGDAVGLAPEIGVALGQDLVAGTPTVNVIVRSKIRWKVGTFVSGGYHLYVNCPAIMNSGGRRSGIGGGEAAITYQFFLDCRVDV
ncbi:NDR1/HIN1-like protein 1 [Salvia splendens]|uniref:NDR1/HIN1-like protein 1 n=1 Tax=Salvia splendens TaxID=180675 RepID=UPI0011031030|nr:NDR1/HIN1-like protein 1 [Salvia splendens]